MCLATVTDASNVASESNEEFVDCGELIRRPDIQGYRSRVERILVVRDMAVGEGIQPVCHVGVIGRTDLPFLHVREEIIYAVLHGTLIACRDGGSLDVIPRCMIRREGIISRDVAREVNVAVQLRGRSRKDSIMGCIRRWFSASKRSLCRCGRVYCCG